MAIVRSTNCESDCGEKSLENDVALRAPKNTRRLRFFAAASFRLSILPSRTVVENSSASRTTTSAAVAPARVARPTRPEAICSRSVSAMFVTQPAELPYPGASSPRSLIISASPLSGR